MYKRQDSWFNNPVYWKGRLISPQNETKFKLYFCGELIDNSIVGKQTSPLAIYADSVHSGERITLFDERYNGYEALLIEDNREHPLSPEIQFVDKDAETEFEIIILGCSSCLLYTSGEAQQERNAEYTDAYFG